MRPPSIWRCVDTQFCDTPRPCWHVSGACVTGTTRPSASTQLFERHAVRIVKPSPRPNVPKYESYEWFSCM